VFHEDGTLDDQAKAPLAEALAAADEAACPAPQQCRTRGVRGFVFDAGAFIALERRSPLLLGILDEALLGTVEVVLPGTVIRPDLARQSAPGQHRTADQRGPRQGRPGDHR
jgi:hypothetical protein